MSRFINAENLSKVKYHNLPYTHIVPNGENVESYERGWNDAIDAIIENEPTADVVEVTSCKYDCVSREKVMNIIDAEAWSFCDWLIREGRNAEQQPVSHYADNLREKINDKTELPSVTSKKKVGRWTLVDNFVDTTCECSSCHYKDYIPKEIDITYWFKRKYCPNCGCMMIDEPEMKCGED